MVLETCVQLYGVLGKLLKRYSSKQIILTYPLFDPKCGKNKNIKVKNIEQKKIKAKIKPKFNDLIKKIFIKKNISISIYFDMLFFTML